MSDENPGPDADPDPQDDVDPMLDYNSAPSPIDFRPLALIGGIAIGFITLTVVLWAEFEDVPFEAFQGLSAKQKNFMHIEFLIALAAGALAIFILARSRRHLFYVGLIIGACIAALVQGLCWASL